MTAPYYYCLLIEVDPKSGGPYLKWLRDGHIEEVTTYPGFRSGKMVAFEEKAGDSWDRFLVVYEVESQAVLKGYWKSDFFAGFKKKAEEFQGTFRITRMSGSAVLDFS